MKKEKINKAKKKISKKVAKKKVVIKKSSKKNVKKIEVFLLSNLSQIVLNN